MLDLVKGFDTKYTLTSPNGQFKLEKYLTLLSTGNQVIAHYLMDEPDEATKKLDTIKPLIQFFEYKNSVGVNS